MTGERLTGIDQGTLLTERLGGEKTDINNSVVRFIAAGRIEGRTQEGVSKGQRSAVLLISLLQEFQTAHPVGSINLSKMADQLRVSRQYAWQSYKKLSAKHTLPPKSHGGMEQLSPEYLAKLDQEVAGLTHQGIVVDQIAGELYVPVRWVKALQKRSTLQNPEQEKQDRDEFRSKVEQLRNKGVGNKEIAAKLVKSRSQVQHIVGKLVVSGDVQKMRQVKSQHELTPFDVQAKELRAAGLTYVEIAQHLGPLVTVSHILASLHRLQARGEIVLQIKQRNKSVSSQ